MSSSTVLDRGYRRYEGPREARARRLQTLFVAGLRRALGLRRTWRAKIVPWSLILLAFTPVQLFLLFVLAGVENDSSTFSYGGYLEATTLLLLPLAAVTAAEIVCGERREKLLTLIFTRPVTSAEYVGAKLAVVLAILASVTLAPLALLFVGNAFSAPDPAVYLTEHLYELPRILAASLVVIAYFGAVALAVASLFDRRGLAVVATLGGILVASVVVNTVAALALARDSSPAGRWIRLLDPAALPYGVVDWIFGQPVEAGAPTGPVALVALAIYVLVSLKLFLSYATKAGA